MIGEMLIDEGVITPEQLEQGLREQKKTGDFICTALAKMGIATEEKIFLVLSRQLNIPYVKLKDLKIESSVIKKVPAKFASHYRIIPIELKDHTLTIAMADPLDLRTLDDVRLLLGLEVKGVLSSDVEILDAIRKYYGVGAETLEKIISQRASPETLKMAEEGIEDLEVLAEDASIIKFVNQILAEAVKEEATDLHLEPFQNELRVRARIDGLLYDMKIPESIKFFHAAIVSRIKIMARLDIAERRLPHDGRIKIKVSDQELDLRVSIVPTIFGESVQIRILSTQYFLELEKLGLLPEDLNLLKSVITRPHGIIFVTGPTGSGKSTTLYASLSRINSTDIKIITIEDPVEHQLRGVSQIQVSPHIGLDFAKVLRHILRHDPDVIMVGEVRDVETGEIAIRSALTGHLVFSTLHTNDAAGAVTRLLDMGMEPFLVASSVECLIAQRLVRLICPDCKIPLSAKAKKETLDQIKACGFDTKNIDLVEGKGCERCRFTGYKGRTGIYEIIMMTEPIRELILKRASSQQIKRQAISGGMRTLRQDGLRKVAQGLTTFTEVLRVTQHEEIS